MTMIVGCPVCRRPAVGAACHDRCAAHVRLVAAALARISAGQRDRALELIADGAVTPGQDRGVWLAVSSDGSTTYPAGATFCGCPAQVTCYHSAAVIIAAAAAATLPAAAGSGAASAARSR